MRDTVTIRLAKEEDAKSIGLVHVESWKTTYSGIVPDAYIATLNADSRSQTWLERLRTGDAAIIVAEDEGRIFGFVSGGKARDQIEGFDAELYAIYLIHSEQRQGVGRLLTRYLTNLLYDDGFRSMYVWVLSENPAVNFYKRLGGNFLTTKAIEIGGFPLEETAFGWRSLDPFRE